MAWMEFVAQRQISGLTNCSADVAHLATKLLAKLEEICGLRTPEPDWNITWPYKATIEYLEMKSSQMVAILFVLVEHGYNLALSNLLASSDSHQILSKLIGSHASAERLLETQIASADRMLERLKKGSAGLEELEDGDLAVFQTQQAIHAFDRGMKKSTSRLESLQVEFDQLHKSFLEEYFYFSAILPTRRDPSPDWDKRERMLRSAFNDRPFHLTLHNAVGMDIITDPELISQLSDSYLRIAKTMGKDWVEKNLGIMANVMDFVQMRARLLDGLLSTIDISIALVGREGHVMHDKQFAHPERDEYETQPSRFALMRGFALKGIDVIKSGHLSIAFYGTAEAG